MNKRFITVGAFILFLLVSIFFVYSFPEKKENQFRSTELTQQTNQNGDKKKTDYLDKNGKITVASDLGYATVIEEKTNNGTIEKYYDAEGNPVSRYPGYYGRIRETDDEGFTITYIDMNGDPVNLLIGYCKEKHRFIGQKKIETISYYAKNGKQVYSLSDGYIKQNEYDEGGRIISTSYLDEYGKFLKTRRGYSRICFSYYTPDDIENKEIIYEFYYDELGNPISLSLGQYGVCKEYFQAGKEIMITYINSDGEPIITSKGYTSVSTEYQGNAYVERYYDLEGNPFSLQEGQYGIWTDNAKTVFLDKEGNRLFNIKNSLYNNSWLVVASVLISLLLSLILGRKMNLILLMVYGGIIIYLTLLFRDSNAFRRQSILLGNFRYFFIDNDARVEVFRNVLLFIPLGGVLYRLYPQKLILLVPIALSIMIECVQFFTGVGFGGLEDIISNSLGGWIGFEVEKKLSELWDSMRYHGSKRIIKSI